MTKKDLKLGQILLPATKQVEGFSFRNLSEFVIFEGSSRGYENYGLKITKVVPGEDFDDSYIGNTLGYYTVETILKCFKLKNDGLYEIF